MKVPLMVNEAAMRSKDDCQEHVSKMKSNKTKGYKNRICVLDEHEIAEVILAGHTIVPAILDENQSLNNKHFKHQQLFGLDFDNNDPFDKDIRSSDEYYMTYERIMGICNHYDIASAIIHETFSSTSEWKRYRVLFITREPISDCDYRRKFLNSLLKLFAINGLITADTKCVDEGRIFYAGHTIVSIKQGTTIDPDEVIQKARNITVNPMESKSRANSSRMIEKKACNQLVEAIMNKDQNLYTQLLSNAVEKAAKADGYKTEAVSGKTQTINLKYLLKDYSLGIDEYGLAPVESVVCDDVFRLTSFLPLDIMLGIPHRKLFSCILPGHEDVHPSASINQLEDGSYAYNCWGCIEEGRYRDIIDVFSLLMNSSVGEAIKFILDSIRLEVQTEWQKQQKETISYSRALINSDYFKRHYETLYKTLVNAKALGQLNFYLSYAMDHITPSSLTRDGKLSFFLSIRKASELMKTEGYTGISKEAISRKLNYLCMLGLLDKVQAHELPTDILARAIDTAKQKAAQSKTEYDYRQDFLYVPNYTAQLFIEAQAMILESKSLGARRSYLSREQIKRTYGKTLADSIYTQDIDRDDSKKAQKFYSRYCDEARDLIATYGFASEADILKHIRGYGAGEKKRLSGQCLPQLLIEYQYMRISVNKDSRAEHAIPSKYKSGSIMIVAGL